ncbi:MAG: FAD-dependent oxidoreductase [Moheibacter sp.]
MIKIKFLIVGQGVAGSCFALKLIRENKSFLIIDQDKNKASKVAVGVFNPVVLKRFSLIWDAEPQLRLMHQYFEEFEKICGQKLISQIPTYRIFKDPDEVRTWQKKSKKQELLPFISKEIITTEHANINSPLGYAEVRQTGRIKLGECLNAFKNDLTEKNQYINQRFDYSKLQISDDRIQYGDISAEKIIFCEGYGVKDNPWFKDLPVIGVKGEVLKIRTSTLVPKAIWKAFNFLMPIENDICFTASTYDRDDLTPEPTEKGKQEIMKHLEEIYKGSYSVIDHSAGIRPTVVDRRPLVGSHPKFKNMYILNGMGTRGTLLAPRMTEYLYDYIENGTPINSEADVRRFYAG